MRNSLFNHMVYEYHLLHHATVVEHIIKSVARDYTMQAAAQSPSEMFGNLLREPRWEQCFWDTVPREVTMVIGAWSTHTTSRETVGAVDLPELQHRIWCKWCECMSIICFIRIIFQNIIVIIHFQFQIRSTIKSTHFRHICECVNIP